jgi:hypothetical protein
MPCKVVEHIFIKHPRICNFQTRVFPYYICFSGNRSLINAFLLFFFFYFGGTGGLNMGPQTTTYYAKSTRATSPVLLLRFFKIRCCTLSGPSLNCGLPPLSSKYQGLQVCEQDPFDLNFIKKLIPVLRVCPHDLSTSQRPYL